LEPDLGCFPHIELIISLFEIRSLKLFYSCLLRICEAEAGGVAQMVPLLLGRHEALSSNPSPSRKKKKEKRICEVMQIASHKNN
jgi:hypothetical protein